jgi:phosphoribosylanthranilate isomerase
VTAEIKFCGLTRREDASFAVALGAQYVGAIFASGPRLLSAERAADVFTDVPRSVRRVGVFANQREDAIARIARDAALDVIQLHGAFDVHRIEAVRRAFGGELWSVCRIAGSELPANFADISAASDAVLLDAYVPGALGGTGVALPWMKLAAALNAVRGGARIVLAGGLRPENVADAIASLAPAVVDVSSGVESAPGIKDHERMRAFRDAVVHTSILT